MQRAHKETRRPTRGGPRGGVCGKRKVPFQGYCEHPRTEETLHSVPPESQASPSPQQGGARSLTKLFKKGQPRPLSTNPMRKVCECTGMGAHPTKGACFSYAPPLLDPPFTGFSDTSGKAQSQTEPRQPTQGNEKTHTRASAVGGSAATGRFSSKGILSIRGQRRLCKRSPPKARPRSKLPNGGGAMFHETGQPRSLSTNPITQAYKCARVGRSPNGGGFFFLTALRLLDPPFHGLLGHNRESIQPDGAPVARQGTGSATTNSGAGT